MTPHDTDSSIERAAQMFVRAQHIACLTGAGVSAESGVSTFRDAQTGLWSQFDAQRLASQEGFAQDPGLVWRWYMERLQKMEQSQPNPGHSALAALEERTRDFTLATQNIDDLHERAGSRAVLHLHGRISAFRCNECDAEYRLRAEDREAAMPPVCAHCNGWIRPGVVWFGEMLPERVLDQAYRAAQRCDLMLVVGTSGIVYPAASLPEITRRYGGAVIDINPEDNAIAAIANVSLRGTSGVVLPRLVEALLRAQEGR